MSKDVGTKLSTDGLRHASTSLTRHYPDPFVQEIWRERKTLMLPPGDGG